MTNINQINYPVIPTGDDLLMNIENIINCKVGEYIVTVKINDKNEFLGIQNVALDKIFYSHEAVKGNFDVSKYYEDATD
ncbi:MAG: hypothetical protein KAY50_07680 [Chitinophagaceae bacterium]|nr:hypothetical protein [Chitinophagaceae bacterium]